MNGKRIVAVLMALFILSGGIIMTSCDKTPAETSETGSSEPNVNTSSEQDGPSSEQDEPSSEIPEPVKDPGNLALGCPYYYDCGLEIDGDDFVKVLTDGKTDEFVTLTPALDTGSGYTITGTDWSGKPHNLVLDNSTAAISVDLGFMADITEVKIFIDSFSGGKCELFYSTDGSNYSFYAGEFEAYADGAVSLKTDITAKSVMAVLPISPETELRVSDIKVYGSKEAEKILLSHGASYSVEGSVSKRYPETGNKLTDGITFETAGEDAVLALTGNAKDALTGKSGATVTVDLGSIMNVSEVSFGAYVPKSGGVTLPDRINVRYSEDGNVWTDFGQSYLLTSVARKNTSSNKYCVTRNHTVKARYVKLYTYLTSIVLLDELNVYGCEKQVDEPDYGFINRKNQLSNTNIAAFAEASLNGIVNAALTDMTYTTEVKGVSGQNVLTVKLNRSYSDICGICITSTKQIDIYSVFCGDKKVDGTEYRIAPTGRRELYVFFDYAEADTVRVELKCGSALSVREISVFAGQPQLPLVRGGFFQLQTNGAGNNAAANNSDYSWYLQLKGMKDMGMDWVVMQYTANYLSKTTLVNGAGITAAGYKYTPTYGSADLYESVLTAADKLGMKVFLGTMHDSDFTVPSTDMVKYKGLVNDSFIIIKDIFDMYGDGSHPSFAGYYLSDEECDQWLNMRNGVDSGRYVYKNQSDYIREIAPDAKIMIAPAIWRSGAPATSGDNLYRLIASDADGEKPVADIVAAQDCLGRTGSLYVSPEVFSAYEEHVAEWAKAVRRAGAEFWHDMEIFEQVSTTKRYEEVEKSLGIEAKLSGSIIVFDIPHYFTTFPMTAYNDVWNYYKRLIMRDYARYYAGLAALDAFGADADAPKVITDDGKKVSLDGRIEIVKPDVKDLTYNPGVITALTPDISDLSKLNWQNFATKNPAASRMPQYAYSFDSDNFYIAVRTYDTTESFGKGVWWEGKDDLIQIWLTSTGNTVADATADGHGIRYYLHRTGKDKWAEGGVASSSTSLDGFKYTVNGDTVIISMPWKSLGRTVPSVGDGTAIGVKVQYIDGADSTWAASDGTNGTNIIDSALFSY